MTVELVIFDCDGMLIDSELLACRTDAEYLTEIGFPNTTEDILERYVGLSAGSMFADLEARFGRKLPAKFPDRLHEWLAVAFAAELQAMAGMEAALQALTCRVCVASSSTPQRLHHTLGMTGLLRYFAPDIFSATQVARGKPAPDLFLFAAERISVRAHRCVVVEDSVAGVKGAVAAGMRVLGFTGGSHCGPGHADRLSAAGAAEIFSDMSRLPTLLGQAKSARLASNSS